MTLSPSPNRHVRGVPSTRYPINKQCAHPECPEPAVDAHHCFRRSEIGNDSWFVEVEEDNGQMTVIPHVVGLCRPHHEEVTIHTSWIRLEDWEFRWYERVRTGYLDSLEDEWDLIGPLNPQPGSVEPKPKRKRKQGEARRKRRTISIRVPNDTENGGEIWDDTLARVKDRLVNLELYGEFDKIPDYEAGIAAWNDWLNSGEYVDSAGYEPPQIIRVLPEQGDQ